MQLLNIEYSITAIFSFIRFQKAKNFLDTFIQSTPLSWRRICKLLGLVSNPFKIYNKICSNRIMVYKLFNNFWYFITYRLVVQSIKEYRTPHPLPPLMKNRIRFIMVTNTHLEARLILIFIVLHGFCGVKI